ncbi:NAD(P)-dependent oxidoreductase [Amycolatopsis jejuensis]|uniref:NAD(P)-dependent oxidoreductase n=1 Tax=Amycolatopsis jejuensis TaxID=330084 RepID=UPI00068AAE63|nr:2-hydroxyacid dehydrogenase [Amycolatopsis jejuensis]
MKPRFVLALPLFDEAVHADLRQRAHVVVCPDHDEATVAAALAGADVLIARGPAKFGAALFDRADRLSVVATVGSGSDSIDVGAATRAGIVVTNGAGVAPVPVAEYVLGALVLGQRRLLEESDRLFRGGYARWDARYDGMTGRTASRTRLGLAGLGQVGTEVARRAVLGLGMETRYFDPRATPPAELGLTPAASLDELFAWADTVSLHVPLTPSTRHLVGAAQLALLGPDGVLINTSRGPVLDQPALLAALRAGTIRSAIIDVIDPEPPDADTLAVLAGTPGLFVTPHIAGVTREALHDLSRSAVERAFATLAGERPSSLVNPEVWDVRRRFPAG